jgi:hypothetical protein
MCLIKLRKVEESEDEEERRVRVRVRRRSHEEVAFPTIPPPAVIPIPAPQPRPIFVEAPRRRSRSPRRVERDVQFVTVSPSSSEDSVELVHHPGRHRSRSRGRSDEEVVFEERREVRVDRDRSPPYETYRYVNAPEPRLPPPRERSRRRSVSRQSRDEYEDDIKVRVRRTSRQD